MAKIVLTNAFLSIDGNDVSSNLKAVTLNYSADEVDNTHFGDDTHAMLGGLKNWSIDCEFSQDFAAGQLDSILFPLVGTQITAILRPDAGVVTTSNPNYTGTVLLPTYVPLTGNVGDKSNATVRMVAGGTLSRATS